MLKKLKNDAAFAALFFCLLCGFQASAFAEDEVFYSDDHVVIHWPSSVAHVDCRDSIKAKAGATCMQVGENGQSGVVFFTNHPGYALGSESALEEHLKQSEGALSDIPRIHVMQSRVVSQAPLIGMLEVLREDGTLREIEGFADSPVRQTSLLIPTGDRLVQIFIYLPENGDDGVKLYEPLVMGLKNGIVVHEPGIVHEDSAKTPAQGDAGIVSLLPRALFWGILIAAVMMLVFSIQHRIRRRQRERESRLQDAQLVSEIEIASEDDGDNDGRKEE